MKHISLYKLSDQRIKGNRKARMGEERERNRETYLQR